MRPLRTITLLATLIIAAVLATPTWAQETAQERAASLRLQLVEVQSKQSELQLRLRQLEEDMKPENIEKTLSGVGSTRPEDLREQRRRQLETERSRLQSQVDLLTASRTRLETAVAQADVEVYRQSVGVSTPQQSTATPTSTGATPQPAATQPRYGAQPRAVNSTIVRRRIRRLKRNKPKPRHARRRTHNA